MKSFFITISISIISGICCFGQTEKKVFVSPAYTIYGDKVTQGKFTAKAISDRELTSDYQSPSNLYKSAQVDFKFSINGKDNEMEPKYNHHYLCVSNTEQTPIIKFGDHSAALSNQIKAGYLQANTKFNIKLDMRQVLAAFKENGYYTLFNGDKLFKNDFKGVFIAGNTAPLIWDFNNLVNHPELELKDPDGDGIYETTLILNKPQDEHKTASFWKLSKNISAFPQYHSDDKLPDALYNLALEEMQNAIEPDSTFRTGKEWAGVWTRDISYSIILSMAVLQPKVAVFSLMRKVKDGRIIQDTGTGGAYPVSSDRMIWAVAAWEVYKVTGDKEWLKKAYAIIKKSADEDYYNVYDQQTGLVRGESSFLDWREETYPKWMQPADIYESECLGTGVVHFKVNQVLSAMATLLNDAKSAEKYAHLAERIQQGIQKQLWMPDKGYYGQYLYGRNFKTLSPRSEALGEALAVYFDAADENRAKTLVSHVPVNAFGIPCIYPQIPNIPPYHNNAVWPFVETYWALAAAHAGNEGAVLRAISAVYRPTALFLTNKENFVSTDGDFAGTQINSSNMLWSLSGNIALVYKVLFGIRYNEHSLEFRPFVPQALAGKRTLTNYKYRGATLDVEINGFGNRISSMMMDGKKVNSTGVPAELTGQHSIVINLAGFTSKEQDHTMPDYTAPETPVAYQAAGMLRWTKIKNAVVYTVVKNGRKIAATKASKYKIDATGYAEYQVAAIDHKGVSSFLSEPLAVTPAHSLKIVEAENVAAKSHRLLKGFSGDGFVEISSNLNTALNFNFTAAKDGIYIIDFRYANGNGPINTENKCAIRTFNVNGKFAGTIVFPQRGKDEWSNWGYSNAVKVSLLKGPNQLSLNFTDANTNMNGTINQAMIDKMRIISF